VLRWFWGGRDVVGESGWDLERFDVQLGERVEGMEQVAALLAKAIHTLKVKRLDPPAAEGDWSLGWFATSEGGDIER
jgi:hypothetical protein